MSRLLRGILYLVILAALGFLAITPLDWQTQAKIGVLMFVASLALHWSSRGSRAITLTMMLFSLFASSRYFYWRVSETYRYWSASGSSAITADLVFVVLLLLAETYAFVILALGYFQSARPLGRKPEPLPADPAEWPVIDVFIPTYNEPLDLVRATIVAARLIDWPADKLRVYLLDDGDRADFRAYCEQTGVGYFAREGNKHAKAGNINHALWRTNGEYVVILDCDHIPTRSFLQITMGWFLRDPKLGMLQTPHHFYSPDPFERNLNAFRRVPNEGNLFYGVVQDGNDLWNATFFCGSAAVLRRTALEEVGGIAVETVTEDAHTSLRLQRRGWNTAYVNLPVIGGLATASLSDHITQRVRWARGMVQILRVENPLFASGLTFAQRLCYFNCMIHFLYALPRLIFLTSPLVYLLLGLSNFYGSVFAITAYAFPHLALALVTNSRVQGRFRHSFWNEIYETVLSPYFVLPTLLAIIHPAWGKFNVTPKSRSVEHTYLDWRISTPFLILLVLNIAGLAVGIPRMLLDSTYAGTVAVNVFWTAFNTLTLAAAVAASQEKRQMRRSERLDLHFPATVRTATGEQSAGESVNVSWTGIAVRTSGLQVAVGDHVAVGIANSGEFAGKVVNASDGIARIRFDSFSRTQEQRMTRLLFGRADSWLRWREPIPKDNPVRSLFAVCGLALRGLFAILTDAFRVGRGPSPEPVPARSSAALPLLLLLAALLSILAARTWAAPAPRFTEATPISSLGHPRGAELRGLTGSANIELTLPVTKLVSTAVLHLRYRPAPGLSTSQSQFRISLNGSPVAELPLTTTSGTADVDLPGELFVTENTIQIALAGECSGCAAGELVTRIDAATSVEISGNSVPLANEVALLPAPFFIPTSQRALELPFVFDGPTDHETLRAAGVLASWFGALTDHRGASFPVLNGTLPTGNVVVFTRTGSPLALRLGLANVPSPAVAIRDNPADEFSKALIVVADDAAGFLRVSQSLALGVIDGTGDSISITAAPTLAKRAPYDAPRWVRSSGLVPLVTAATAEQYRIFGDGSAQVYFRLAPDLHFDAVASVPLTVSIEAANLGVATLTAPVRLNGTTIGSFTLSPQDTGKVITRTFVAPVNSLFPRNTLTVDFAYRGAASTTVPSARVTTGTQLDLRQIPHFVRLPRLDLFAKAGFPFTQMADLSTTAVVLPPRPTTAQIGTYLEAVAFLSAQTGYPGVGLVLETPEQAARSTKDLLVIGAGEDQPLFTAWSANMPANSSEQAWRVLGGRNPIARLWARPFGSTTADEETLEQRIAAAEVGDVLLQGFAHPTSAGRAVVALAMRSANTPPALARVLNDLAASSAGAASVAIGGPKGVAAADIPAATVDRGRLSGLAPAFFWMESHAVVLPLVALALVALLGFIGTRLLDLRAARRLEGQA